MKSFFYITAATLDTLPGDFWIKALGTKPLSGNPTKRENCVITAPVWYLRQIKHGPTIIVEGGIQPAGAHPA